MERCNLIIKYQIFVLNFCINFIKIRIISEDVQGKNYMVFYKLSE